MRRNLFLFISFFLFGLVLVNGTLTFSFTDSLTIESLETLTNVNIVSVGSGTSSVDVTGTNGASETWVKFDAASNKLSISQANSLKNGSDRLVSISRWSTWAMVCAFASIFISDKKTLIMLSMCLALSLSLLSQAANETFEVTVNVAPGTTFSNFQISLASGDISGGNFEVSNGRFIISTTGTINVGTFGIASSFIAQGPQDVAVTDISLRSNTFNVEVDAGVNAVVMFRYFQGTATVNHGVDFQSQGPHCTVNAVSSTQKSISCGSKGTLSVSATANATLNFGYSCATSGGADYVPPSPAISSNLASTTTQITLNVSNWVLRDRWTNSPYTETSDSVNGLQFVSTNAWKGDWQFLVCDECFGYLRPNNQYTVNFSLRSSSAKLSGVVFGLLINPDFKGYYELPDNTFWVQPNRYLAVSNITGPFTSTFKAFSTQFTVTQNLYSSYFVWNQDIDWNPNANVNTNYFSIVIGLKFNNLGTDVITVGLKDVSFTSSSESVSSPTPITVNSELVVLPTPNPSLDPNPRGTNCPWTQTGLMLWEDPATWGGSVPSPTATTITLPANTKVLVTSCSFNPNDIYNRVVIPVGSELIFSDAPISWSVRNVFVQGKFRIGSSTCRVFSNITITFYGSKTTSDIISAAMGSKGIGVAAGGEIDIHGKQFHNTWSRLAASIFPGNDRLIVQDDINWEVGQQVIVTTSIIQDEWWPQNEVRTIKAISGRTIQFTEPFQFFHYAGSEYQVEVGLLSRRIVLQGDVNSEVDQFGGHVLVQGIGRFSGVATTRMGQKNMLARYPLHFHIADNSGQSFVRDSSFNHNYYRCITVHGTHNILITRNVAYDINGHCYYFEDGVEENSTISFNLASYVHVIGTPAAGGVQAGVVVQSSPTLVQPADIGAAGFYITNAFNNFTGNAASGGWVGFSFPNLFKPIGNAVNTPFNPAIRITNVFSGNTAHSTGYFWSSGSGIYCGGNLYYDNSNILTYNSGRVSRGTVTPTGAEGWMRYDNIKVFLVNQGINHWGDRLELYTFEAHDVNRGSTTFGESAVVNAIINGKSNNPLTGVRSSYQGFQFYDTWVNTILSNIRFRNYQPIAGNTNPDPTSNNFAIVSMTHSDKFKPQGISATRAITYTNIPRSQFIGHYIRDTGASRYFNFVDFDGSATASSGPTIVGAHEDWWQISPLCRKEWLVWICPKGTNEIANLEISSPLLINNDVEPPHGTSIHVGRVYLFGDGMTNNRSSVVTNIPGITGVTGKGWFLDITGGTPSTLNVFTNVIPTGQYVVLAIPYPAGTTFRINAAYRWDSRGRFNVTSTTSIANMMASPNGSLFFFSNGILYLKLVCNVQVNPPFFERDNVRIYSIQNSYSYTIVASNCGPSNPTGQCTPTSTAVPTITLP